MPHAAAIPYPIQPPPADIPPLQEALQILHNRITDALEGFRVMQEKAEPSFRPTVARFVALHERQAAMVGDLLLAQDQHASLDGTLMGTVNKAVVSIRALFDSIDADALDRIRDGEQHVIDAFTDALAADPSPANARILEAMRAELLALVEATRAIG